MKAELKKAMSDAQAILNEKELPEKDCFWYDTDTHILMTITAIFDEGIQKTTRWYRVK